MREISPELLKQLYQASYNPLEHPALQIDWATKTLSDLLDWLKEKGFGYAHGYIPSENKHGIKLFDKYDKEVTPNFYIDTSDADAAAKAVLWVLEQEQTP